jgi:hypothetical protein
MCWLGSSSWISSPAIAETWSVPDGQIRKPALMKDRVDSLARSAKSRSKSSRRLGRRRCDIEVSAVAARSLTSRRVTFNFAQSKTSQFVCNIAGRRCVTDLVRTRPNDTDWISHVSRQLIRKRPPQISAAAVATVEFSILRQNVDFTKLFLYLVDPLGTVGESFSVARGYHYRPTGLARYNREFDRWRAVSKGRELLPKNPDQVGVRNFFLSQ